MYIYTYIYMYVSMFILYTHTRMAVSLVLDATKSLVSGPSQLLFARSMLAFVEDGAASGLKN